MTAQMKPGSRILQYLTLRPNVSFDDPVSPDGRQWDSALKHVTQSQGWTDLNWGRRLESKDVVDILISKFPAMYRQSQQYWIFHTHAGWRSHPDLQHFMTHNYRSWLSAIEPLLLLDGSSNPTPPPYLHNLHPGMPYLDPGAVSSIFELAFSPDLDADIKITLGIERQLCQQFFNTAAKKLDDDGDFFHGLDAVWVEQYHPIPSSSPSSTTPDSAIGMERGGESQQKTLLVVMEWASQEAEEMVSDSDRIEDMGNPFTVGEYFAKEFLLRASSYVKHQVVFETVMA